jgi:hypothetical protein
MESNRQHFDECQPIECHTVGVMQMGGWQIDELRHATVYVDAQYRQLFTTVGAARATRTTTAALEVWPHGDIITDCDRLHPVPQCMHRHGQLVTEHARIPKERLAPSVGVQVSPTNPHPAYPYLDPTRRWCVWHMGRTQSQICDIVEGDLEHAGLFSDGVR